MFLCLDNVFGSASWDCSFKFSPVQFSHIFLLQIKVCNIVFLIVAARINMQKEAADIRSNYSFVLLNIYKTSTIILNVVFIALWVVLAPKPGSPAAPWPPLRLFFTLDLWNTAVRALSSAVTAGTLQAPVSGVIYCLLIYLSLNSQS